MPVKSIFAWCIHRTWAKLTDAREACDNYCRSHGLPVGILGQQLKTDRGRIVWYAYLKETLL